MVMPVPAQGYGMQPMPAPAQAAPAAPQAPAPVQQCAVNPDGSEPYMITLIGNLKKGGTGKSTVTFNLALWVATRHNKHVIVYDLDPQATTSDAFEIRAG